MNHELKVGLWLQGLYKPDHRDPMHDIRDEYECQSCGGKRQVNIVKSDCFICGLNNPNCTHKGKLFLECIGGGVGGICRSKFGVFDSFLDLNFHYDEWRLNRLKGASR